MKTIGSVISLSFLVILLLVTPVIGSSEWVELTLNGQDDLFSYNKINIKHLKKGIVQVWVKTVHSDEGKNNFIKSLGKYGSKYNSLSYQVSLDRIDCKNNMIQILSNTMYGKDREVIHSISIDEPEWEYIIPDSVSDVLRRKVCK